MSDFYMFVASCLLCVAGFITFTLNEDRQRKASRTLMLIREAIFLLYVTTPERNLLYLLDITPF